MVNVSFYLLFTVAQEDDFVAALKKSPASYPLVNYCRVIQLNCVIVTVTFLQCFDAIGWDI